MSAGGGAIARTTPLPPAMHSMWWWVARTAACCNARLIQLSSGWGVLVGNHGYRAGTGNSLLRCVRVTVVLLLGNHVPQPRLHANCADRSSPRVHTRACVLARTRVWTSACRSVLAPCSAACTLHTGVRFDVHTSGLQSRCWWVSGRQSIACMFGLPNMAVQCDWPLSVGALCRWWCVWVLHWKHALRHVM